MKRIVTLFALVSLFAAAAAAQAAFSFTDLMQIRRVGGPQLSPDNSFVVFTVGTVDMAANKVVNQIFTVRPDGSDIKQITSGATSSSAPRWSPDGKRIAYVTGGQIWTMQADGDDRKQVTRTSTGASGPVWSPDGKWIAFVSDVYPECTSDDCNKAEDARVDASKVLAHVTERLLYRHWVEWRDRKRTHVLVVPSGGGPASDFTAGDFDSPPYAASSNIDYAFSPDSREIAYLRNPDKVEAISTNSDIYVASLFDKTQKSITSSNKGYDATPIYTPDGKYILYRSQATPAFEADRWRIMRYNRATGETVELTRGFDQQVDEIAVSGDSQTIYFTAGEKGYTPIFMVPVEPDFRQRIATFVKPIVSEVAATDLSVARNGKLLIFGSSSAAAPTELMAATPDGTFRRRITSINDNLLSRFSLASVESVNWTGAVNSPVQGFIVKPANFDATKKYPLLVLIHGGPQGAWNDAWGYRWNPQIFANAGFIVFMPNQRGSTGFGQKFVNDVSGDWGGKSFIDIKNGVAEVLKRPYIDKSRIGAAGASYGGYMVDWLLGHNDDPRFKFKTFVSHAGVYNLESMAGATEELWFTNWEFKGTPWTNPVLYQKWSPNKFANKFDTPTLVTAGEMDFRVPYDQSMQLFTALQLRNVPSKFILFPDEGHWILKPQNSQFWYSNVLDWLDKHLK